MTRDDIIRIAREAGWTSYDSQDERFERFFHAAYAAGAAAEREACAKVCEELRPSKSEFDQRYYNGCTDSAVAIRARGNT